MRPAHRDGLVRDLRTAGIAVVVTLVATASPSIAAKVANADRVDGRHAVSAKASPAKRAGKLVATDRSGRLPADVVVPARSSDSDRLGGQDAATFRTRVAAPGELMSGVFAVLAVDDYQAEDAVTFPAALRSPIPGARTTVVPPGGSTPQCPGVGEVAVDAWLCVYEAQAQHVSGVAIFDPATSSPGVNRLGFAINPLCTGATCIADGVWAARAP